MVGQKMHNKPIGCSASASYAAGPDDEEEEEENVTKTTGTLCEDLYTFIIISHIIL
jgi:hypothetical protein